MAVHWSRVVLRVGRYVLENVWVEVCWLAIALLCTSSTLHEAVGLDAARSHGMLPCIACRTIGDAAMRWEDAYTLPWPNESGSIA